MTWSIHLARMGRVSLRIHAVFLLIAVVELLRASMTGGARSLAWAPTATALACCFLLAWFHEAVRASALRKSGSDLDEWLLWPLGGLSNATPRDNGQAPSTWVAAAAWMWQAVLGLLLGIVLAWKTGRFVDGAIPMPWSLEGFRVLSLTHSGWLIETLWLLQWCNMVSLSLQLLPAFPLTGGRVLMARLQQRLSWSEAARTTAKSGVVVAVLLLVASLAFDYWMLVAAALVVWISSRETLVRAESSDAFELHAPTDRVPTPRQADDKVEIDRILEKINRGGMASLSFREKWKLRAATRRRRDGGGGNR